jgi:membrane protein implicated in regulation of membrane protease activity
VATADSDPSATAGRQLPTIARYVLFQIPELGAVILVLVALWHTDVISSDLAIALATLWVVKDAALYPFTRDAYRTAVPTGPSQLIGARGVARQAIDPGGYVLVGGTLWRAELDHRSARIEAGQSVLVTGTNRMRLKVAAAPEHDS